MASQAWIEDCLKWRGRVLTGRFAHWCFDYDELPVDETTPEWPCECLVEDGRREGKTVNAVAGNRRGTVNAEARETVVVFVVRLLLSGVVVALVWRMLCLMNL